MNVAIYGGSFDPVHSGHLDTIKKALIKLDIDRLIVVPAFRNPFKTTINASAELRMSWLKRVCSPYKKVQVSDFEIKQKRSTPTIETVDYFSKKYKKIYLIIGSDNLNNLHKWYKFSRLNSKVTFVVATRKGYVRAHPYISLSVHQNVSSSALRSFSSKNFLNKEIANYYAREN